MIVSSAFQAQTTSSTLLKAKMGRKYVAVQNHDAVNQVVVTFGGPAAVLSPPNGMLVKAGEFGELKGRIGTEITIISGISPVDCTVFKD